MTARRTEGEVLLSWWPFVATIVALTLIQGLFGLAVAFWCGTVALAYCVGVLYGAGSEIAKHSTPTPEREERE